MLDINLFRDEKTFKTIIESETKRGKPLEYAENVKKYDLLWRKSKQDKEKLKAEKNKIIKQIPQYIKEKKDISELKQKSKQLDNKIKELEEKEKEYLKLRDDNRYKVGNILFNSVPIGDETKSKVIKVSGTPKVFEKDIDNFLNLSNNYKNYKIIKNKPISHVDFGLNKDLFDLERAAKISGARFYYLKNKFAILHFSILRFAIDKLINKGYELLYTPFMINYDAIKKAAELGDFEESLYKIENENLFLNATSEQTIASYHMNEYLDNLPKKYVGFSTAFRREAGSHSKDTRGIFRVHQFDKIEQYILCKPEDNEKMHKEIVNNAEEILQELELPYRVINIASEDLNDTAALKYDIEAWMPVQGTFREMISASITTDYQTRKLNIKYRDKNETKYVHSLNSTAVASPRILVAIIENHQEDGILKIPKPLQKYTRFKEI